MSDSPVNLEHWFARLDAEPKVLHLRVSERKAMLVLVDLVAVNGALLLADLLHSHTVVGAVDLMGIVKWFITLSVVWIGCALLFDCYNLARAAHAAQSVRAACAAAVATVVIYTLTPWLTPPLSSRMLLLVFAVTAVTAMGAWRLFYAKVFAQPWFKQRALIVGAGHAGRELATALRTASGAPNPYRGTGYDLLGFIDADPALQWTDVLGLPVLGGHAQLLPLAQRLHVDEVIVAVTHRHSISDELLECLLACSEAGLRVTTMAAMYERVLGRVPVSYLGHNVDQALETHDDAGYRFYMLVRRLLDIAVAAPMLVLLAPIALAVAIANAIGPRGPLFYRQVRIGRGGKRFSILKFRSMVPNAENGTGAVWATDHDKRITPVGHFLRRTRLDELPQLWNILCGEMSLIGPRPERPEFVAGLAHDIPFYRVRHSVRPGLTGWAQVQYRYGSSVDDARIKLEYDLYYIKHVQPLLDLQILFRTAAIMVEMKGT